MKWSPYKTAIRAKHIRQTCRGFAQGVAPVGTTILQKAKAGYDAYGEVAQWKNFQGADMPKWDDLPDTIQQSWCSAAKAILTKCLEDIKAYAGPKAG